MDCIEVTEVSIRCPRWRDGRNRMCGLCMQPILATFIPHRGDIFWLIEQRTKQLPEPNCPWLIYHDVSWLINQINDQKIKKKSRTIIKEMILFWQQLNVNITMCTTLQLARLHGRVTSYWHLHIHHICRNTHISSHWNCE